MEFTIQIPAGKDCFHKNGKLCYFHEFLEIPSQYGNAYCNVFGDFLRNAKCRQCMEKQLITIKYAED